MSNKLPTPAFILDEALLLKNLELIKHVQKEAKVSIILAFKGYSMWSTFPMVRQYMAGATASSLNEARLCFEEMQTRAHTYSVAYTPSEFGKMMKYSSHITFNSLTQFKKYKDKVQKSGEPISMGIRVNPEYSPVETDLYNPAVPGSRLGEVVANFKGKWPEGADGLHWHTLCESTSYDLEKVLIALEERFGMFFPQLKWINCGGGHLMTRSDYDVPHLIEVLKRFKAKYPHLNIIMEPGSAVAWETGILTSTVLDIVHSGNIKTAILEVSFTAHMPDTLEMPYRPRVRGAHSDASKGKYQYRLGGVSCLSGDYMDAYGFDAPLKIGQQLIFEDMMHYTMVKTTTFNGVAHPDIAIQRLDGKMEIVKKFGYKDFKTRLS
jgi:carboxynorspermidine decarboxylase